MLGSSSSSAAAAASASAASADAYGGRQRGMWTSTEVQR